MVILHIDITIFNRGFMRDVLLADCISHNFCQRLTRLELAQSVNDSVW
jgi:hypothetical protein